MVSRKRTLCVVAVVVWALTGLPARAETQTVGGKVDTVTLYRGQALITRIVSAEVPEGTTEVVVGDLPHQVLGDSLFASAGEAADIQALRYRERAVRKEPRDEVRTVTDQMEELQKKIRQNEVLQQVVNHHMEYLNKLEQFTAPTAQTEMSKGVLDAGTLAELTQMAFEQREKQAARLLELQEEQRVLKADLDLLARKLAELTAGSSRTVREAVLLVRSDRAGEATLRLSYLVGQAGWDPFYNVRAAGMADNVTLEYNAVVRQMSGEDWEDVNLTLSTASPALRSQGPELAPFTVVLSQEQLIGAGGRAEVVARSFQQQVVSNQLEQIRARGQDDFNRYAWASNAAVSYLQNFELNLRKDVVRRILRPKDEEVLSVTYRLPARLSLPSRRDSQTVEIASVKLPSQFYFVAAPVLTSYVCREADLTNNSGLALLGGPATVYLDGSFVGRTDIPMAAMGQKFTVGFGMDSQLRAGREMVDRIEQELGANRVVQLHYRLTLENYGDGSVLVRLFDRIPSPAEGADIRLTLGEIQDKLSEDPFYLQRERPKGILRWDIEVAGSSAGPEARIVDYDYTLEFDRKLSVVPQREEEAKQEFEKLLELRQRAK